MSPLAQLRAQAGLSQEAVAVALSLDRSTIAKWETGAAKPRFSKIQALADLYGCSIDQIFRILQGDVHLQNKPAVSGN